MLPEVFWVVPTPVWHVDQSPPMFETIRWRSSITWLLAYFLALLTLTVMYASQCMLVLCPYNLLKAIEWKISSFVENTCWTLLKNHFDTLPDIMQKQSYDLLMSIFFSMSCIYFYLKKWFDVHWVIQNIQAWQGLFFQTQGIREYQMYRFA